MRFILDAVPTWLTRVFQGAALLGVLGLSALYAFQEKLLYLPQIPGVSNEYQYLPDKFDLSYEDVWLQAADGTRLHCWHIHGRADSAKAKRPVILFFQENAGNMSWRLPFIAAVVRRLDCAVFVLGYRGYGQSEGSPSEKGLQMDSEAALAHVLQRSDVDHSRIVLSGKSLGGAVALHLASRRRDAVRAVIIENTFTSVEHMVPRVLPLLGALIGQDRPLNFLVRNKWRNYERVQEVGDTPLLMFASVKDDLVPYSHMQELSRLKSTKRFRWVDCPNSSHMDAYDRDRRLYWPALDEFWSTYVL